MWAALHNRKRVMNFASRTWAAGLAGLLAVVLAACQPQAPYGSDAGKKAAPAPAAAPTPPAALAETFKECTWGEVKGATASLWAFSCPEDKVAFNAALPGFERQITGATPSTYPIVRLFTKAADAPLDAALPAIRAASRGAETCVLEPIPEMAGQFQLMPAGPARKRYADLVAGTLKNPTDADYLPCGPLGPSEAGMRIISAVAGSSTLVAVSETGSDVPLYDLSTLKAVTP
jgi:hypothetical protein